MGARSKKIHPDDELLMRHGVMTLPRWRGWRLYMLFALGLVMPQVWRAFVRANREVQVSYYYAAAGIVLNLLGEPVYYFRDGQGIYDDVVAAVTKARAAEGGTGAISVVEREFAFFNTMATMGDGVFAFPQYLHDRTFPHVRETASQGEALAVAASRTILLIRDKGWFPWNAYTYWLVVWGIAGVAVSQFGPKGLWLLAAGIVWDWLSQILAFSWFSQERLRLWNGEIHARATDAAEMPEACRVRPGDLALVSAHDVYVLPGRARRGVFAVLERLAERLPFFGTAIDDAKTASRISFTRAQCAIVLAPLGECLPPYSLGFMADTWLSERVYRRGDDIPPSLLGRMKDNRQIISRESPCFEATPFACRREAKRCRAPGQRFAGEDLAEAAQAYIPFFPADDWGVGPFYGYIYWIFVGAGSVAAAIGFRDLNWLVGIPFGLALAAVMHLGATALYSETALKKALHRRKVRFGVEGA